MAERRGNEERWRRGVTEKTRPVKREMETRRRRRSM